MSVLQTGPDRRLLLVADAAVVLLSARWRLDEMGETFEAIERKQFGGDGFEDAAARIGEIEQAPGFAGFAQFTAPPPEP